MSLRLPVCDRACCLVAFSRLHATQVLCGLLRIRHHAAWELLGPMVASAPSNDSIVDWQLGAAAVGVA